MARKQTKLQRLRSKLKLNQNAFWGRIGVTQCGGSRYETGRQPPRPVLMLLDIAYGDTRRAAKVLHQLGVSRV